MYGGQGGHPPPGGFYQPGVPQGVPPNPLPGMPPPPPRSGTLPPTSHYGVPPPPGPPPPGPIPFIPSAPPQPDAFPQQHPHPHHPQHPQQAFGQPYNPAAYQQAHSQQPFMPQQPGPGLEGSGGVGGPPGFGMPLNPLGLMAAGNLLSGGQTWGAQYVERMQQRVGAFAGGALHFHFAISKQYVLSKLLMLMAPFLKRWNYTRVPEQMQGGAAFKPPRDDVNCPDLYLPLMAVWSYALLVAASQAARKAFKPDNMYPLVWAALMAWAAHLLVARLLLRAMSLPPTAAVPWVELAAYTGYTFVPVCASIAAGQLGGRTAYWVAWAYGSLASAVFLVRTMKRVIFQEARGGYGRDLTRTNYLLLALALFQFPFSFYLGVRP